MAPIKQELEVDGMTASQVYSKLLEVGLSYPDAAIIASGWIFENFGRVKRTFDYAQAFAAVDPTCVEGFHRTFQHTDWVDGESVVQAEQSLGEEGFNQRFHHIEADLDALGADLAKAFTCMAAMRQSLRTLLDEIRAEINRLNATVFDCCVASTPSQTFPEAAPNYLDLIRNQAFIGTTNFGDKYVQVWKTDRGLLMTPVIKTVGVDIYSNPRVTQPAGLARYFAETPAVRESFPEAVSKRELVGRFGKEVSSTGERVSDLVAILPDDQVYPNLEAMIEAVTEAQAAALRTTGGGTEAVAIALGIEAATQQPAEASLDQVASLPPQVRAALVRQGVDTVGKLANVPAERLNEMLAAEGVGGVGIGDTASWTAMAKTLSKIG